MSKIFRFLIIFLIITSWIFSGFPQIFNPSTVFRTGFPPEIQKAQAATGLVFVGSASSTGNSGAFSVSLTNLQYGASSSAAAGDLVIVINGWNGTADGNPGVGTAGYTEVADLYQDDNFDANMSASWKTMGPTPDTSVSCNGSGVTTDGAVCLVHVWRNAASTTPMDVAVVTTGAINGSKTIVNSAITPVTQGAVIVAAVLATDDDNTLPTVPTPNGYSNLEWSQVDPGAAISAGMVSKAWSGSGSDGAANWGNWDTTNTNSWNGVTIAIRPATTFIGNDTDPGINPTIAPEAATTTVGTFNLKTDGYSDTATSTTVTLATGTATATVAVLITNSANTTTYCAEYNSSGDAINLTGCNLPVTNASTTFNIRIKPLTHSAMPASPGGTYAVTALVTSIGSTYLSGGTDTTSDTVTIDNASPNGATATGGTAGDQKVTINWTTSDSGDFDTTSGSVILRWAAGVAGSEVPAEGKSDYTAGNTISTATVACVITSPGSSAQSKIDGSGGSAGCTTDVLTNGQQYTYVAFQRDTNGNYDVGASIGTFTPAGVSLTFTIDTDSVSFVTAITPGTPVSTSSVLTVNTNNSTGYNIKIERASSTETLFLTTDPSTRIADNPNGNNWTAPAATSTAGPSAVWTDGTTKGLGFRVKQTGTAVNTYSSIWWGTSDAGGNALYSGISTSTLLQKIADTTLGAGSNENTTVEYRVDVIGTQKSGTYTSSPIIYTVLAN